jgi:SpoVK/Ycf46/Vps4 family AAA+-type ATPase
MFVDRNVNGLMPTLLREFEKLDGVAILATNRRQILDDALDRRILYKLDFEVPTPAMRQEIWRQHLPPEAPLAADLNLAELAEEFDFTGGLIKNAVLIAVQNAIRRPGPEPRITHADLRAGAILQRSNRLISDADKITPKVGLADVILPPETRAAVEAVVAAARKQSTVFGAWGFGRKLSRGKGVAALFHGPSGTGKTMTAEAIAYELGQNLFPVRVPTLVSKFVGDTEKNLARVFAEARESRAILFFDEADSLFAARVDDHSHHSRYLNQQTDVLLTEIEKFDGLVILATNRADAFDQAFERRVRHRVAFPMPGPAAREAIWRAMIPPEAPVSGHLDFAALARDFDFCGGTIRNVVLRAAFAAAAVNSPISHKTLLQAAAEEQPFRRASAIGFTRKEKTA